MVPDIIVSSDCKEPSKYTIIFDTDGGNPISTMYVIVGSSFTFPKAEKAGHVFRYWLNISNGIAYVEGQTIEPTSSMTLKALYEVISNDDNDDESGTAETSKTYTVYFYNGNTKVDEKSCTKTSSEEHCTVYVPSAPSKEGHTFKGWSLDCDNDSYTKWNLEFYVNDNNANKNYYACFEKNQSTEPDDPEEETTETYKISYDANGGSGAPSPQEKEKGTDITLSTSKPTRVGYTFDSWNTSKEGNGTKYNGGATYNADDSVTLFAQWKNNEYKISYKLNGGTITGNPTSAKYDEEVTINNPSKTVTIVGNDNNTGATISDNVSVKHEFMGWTSTDVDTKNAYYGDKLWSNGNTIVTDTKFKNLTITNGATVTLVANWEETAVTLPTVVKEGYTCNWNSKADGTGKSYDSGEKGYVLSDSPSSVNLYAICKDNAKTDEEVTTNTQTGDALIHTVWAIGIGALGYSVYYFMKRKNNI